MIIFRRTGGNGEQRIVMLGDSLTANVWFSVFARTVELAQNARGHATPPHGSWAVSGAYRTAAHYWKNSRVAGDDCETILAATVAARVTAYAPDIVIHFYGVNCVQHVLSDPTCATNHALILSQIAAANPGVQQMCLGPLCITEKWPDGANADDTALDAKDAIISAAAIAASATYVNLRTAMFAWEAINNPAQDNVGHLTTDGIHLNDAGVQFMSDQVIQFARYE